MVWVLIIGGVVYLARLGSHDSKKANPFHSTPRLGDTSKAQAQLLGSDTGHPTAGFGEQPFRVLAALVTPAGSGGYRFMQTDKNGPLRYDPCRPIHYVIRDHATPAGGKAALQTAIAAVSQATGLKFFYDGVTAEVPSVKRSPYQPARYGDKWAPVLIAWTDPLEDPRLAGVVAGLGGSQPITRVDGSGTSETAYVTGSISLDTPDLTAIFARSDGATEVTAIIKHELGHLV